MKKNKITFIITILLFTGLSLFYHPLQTSHTQRICPIDVLYHGSPNTAINLFKPNDNHIRDTQEGAVVFATPSLKLASCYLFT